MANDEILSEILTSLASDAASIMWSEPSLRLPGFVPGMVKLSGQSPFIREHRAHYPGRYLIILYVKISRDTDTKDGAGFCVQWLATGKDTFS